MREHRLRGTGGPLPRCNVCGLSFLGLLVLFLRALDDLEAQNLVSLARDIRGSRCLFVRIIDLVLHPGLFRKQQQQHTLIKAKYKSETCRI